MANEYVFNYDEVKRRFESVPQTNLITTKKFKSMPYKTRFQPRTKSIIPKSDGRSNMSSLMLHKNQRQEQVTFKLHALHMQHIMPIEQFSLQTQQGFYLLK